MEEWHDLGCGCHEVSTTGSVRSWTNGKWPGRRPFPFPQKPTPTPAGHLQVRVHGKTRLVHRLVLEAFVGPCPPGHECCHRDGDPSNNCLDNLYWGTRSDNVRDAIQHGTHAQASKTVAKCGHLYDRIVHRTNGTTYRYCSICDLARKKRL